MNDSAKEGYNAALKMTDKTGRTVWSVFASLLASNALLLTFAGFILASGVGSR